MAHTYDKNPEVSILSERFELELITFRQRSSIKSRVSDNCMNKSLQRILQTLKNTNTDAMAQWNAAPTLRTGVISSILAKG